ncbi:hypothetical protein QBC35DRAFT_547287 [Podospora australis]|uniref:Uncharacterized protein n=1 Tax=Podospora australis TaxID=1536484 RepID=A0AAN6X2Z9_9PEZI|nr:hypothetical protein QBC35DRAFT_547287 [Podospora australis]
MMNFKTLFVVLATATTGLNANPVPQGGNQGSGSGTGPFGPASYSTEGSLSSHTLYAPKNIPSGSKLPILIWGNGGCSANGLDFQGFLNEISSHGVFVISQGTPNGRGQTNSGQMKTALDWVFSGSSKYHQYLEKSRVSVSGMSCGGVEAYDLAGDSRVGNIGIFNSGLMSPADSQRIAATIRKPVFFFLGGRGDIAYENGERDYRVLPQGTPSWKGNLDVGHGGTYSQPNGGKFGVAAVRFFQWTLRGNATASQFFTNDAEATQAGWQVEKKNLNGVQVTPL